MKLTLNVISAACLIKIGYTVILIKWLSFQLDTPLTISLKCTDTCMRNIHEYFYSIISSPKNLQGSAKRVIKKIDKCFLTNRGKMNTGKFFNQWKFQNNLLLTFVLAMSTIYGSPLAHSSFSKPSRSTTLARELAATISIISPVALYCSWFKWWLMEEKIPLNIILKQHALV